MNKHKNIYWKKNIQQKHKQQTQKSYFINMSFLALVNAQTAGAAIFAHSSLTKMLMTLEYREKMTRPGNEEVAKKIAGSQSFKVTASTQVNEAEYAGLMCAALFYLASQGASEASVGASLCMLGQVGYYWCRRLGGYPFYVPFALARYAGLGLIAYTLYSSLA